MPLSPWFILLTIGTTATVFCEKCQIEVITYSGSAEGRTTWIRTACGRHDLTFHPDDTLEHS